MGLFDILFRQYNYARDRNHYLQKPCHSAANHQYCPSMPRLSHPYLSMDFLERQAAKVQGGGSHQNEATSGFALKEIPEDRHGAGGAKRVVRCHSQSISRCKLMPLEHPPVAKVLSSWFKSFSCLEP